MRVGKFFIIVFAMAMLLTMASIAAAKVPPTGPAYAGSALQATPLATAARPMVVTPQVTVVTTPGVLPPTGGSGLPLGSIVIVTVGLVALVVGLGMSLVRRPR